MQSAPDTLPRIPEGGLTSGLDWARDAAVIADAARTMPHTLRALRLDDERIAELTVLSGFDDDLAQQITATSNRIRRTRPGAHRRRDRP